MHKLSDERLKILLAEDSPDDIKAFKRGMRKSPSGKHYEMIAVIDGEQALNFLLQEKQWVDAWRPDLVVLSICMPKLGGWEIFDRMKADERLQGIPIVIWSMASLEEYDFRAYHTGACGIFTKPVNDTDMDKQIDAILTYFLWANRAPW